MIFELSGAVGVAPWCFTLRELLWMAEGRAEAEWGRFAGLMALTANINRDPKKAKPFKPSDFYPFRETKKQARQMAPLTVLRDVFCRAGKPK